MTEATNYRPYQVGPRLTLRWIGLYEDDAKFEMPEATRSEIAFHQALVRHLLDSG